MREKRGLLLGESICCGVSGNESSVWVGDGSEMVGDDGVSRSDGISADARRD